MEGTKPMAKNNGGSNSKFKIIKKQATFDGTNLSIGGQKIPMKGISLDAWANVLTGLGLRGRDKRMSGQAKYDGSLSERMSEELYSTDALARRICDLLPYEATREWVDFEDKEVQTVIDDEVDRLKARKALTKAYSFSRLYGGSGIFLNTGEPLEELKNPLDLNNIQELKSIIVFNRYELQVNTVDIEADISDSNFDLPTYYNLMPRGGATIAITKIHHSRIIRFDGLELPTLQRVRNQYWGDTVFTALYETLRDFGISYASVASLIQEFRMLVYKVNNLAGEVVGGNSDKLAERMNLMSLSRSVLGAFAIDKEGEEMESMSANVSGLDKLLMAINKRLQASTDIPHTILFNESPTGLSSSGKTEERMWYDYVASQQESYLASKLDQLFTVIFAAKSSPFNGKEPKNWMYKFVPLWQVGEKEQAEIDKLNMETDNGYIATGVTTNSEVREDRKPELEQLNNGAA